MDWVRIHWHHSAESNVRCSVQLWIASSHVISGKYMYSPSYEVSKGKSSNHCGLAGMARLS